MKEIPKKFWKNNFNKSLRARNVAILTKSRKIPFLFSVFLFFYPKQSSGYDKISLKNFYFL